MFKLQIIGTHPDRTRRVDSRLSAPASAIALIVLFAGNVSGAQLIREDRHEALVTPKLSRSVASVKQQMKVATHAGRNVLERG